MVFYDSFYTAAQRLEDIEKLRFFDIVMRYGLFGEEPNPKNAGAHICSMFDLVRPQIDANIEKREKNSVNGKKGGAPIGNQNARKQPKTTENKQNNPNVNVNVNVNDNANANGDVNGVESPNPPAIDYQGVVDLFNKICISLPSVQMVSDELKESICECYDVVEEQGGFEELFQKVDNSDFLSGRVAGYDGKPFRASLRWVLQPQNLEKIYNGQYSNPTLKATSRFDKSVYDIMLNSIDE